MNTSRGQLNDSQAQTVRTRISCPAKYTAPSQQAENWIKQPLFYNSLYKSTLADPKQTPLSLTREMSDAGIDTETIIAARLPMARLRRELTQPQNFSERSAERSNQDAADYLPYIFRHDLAPVACDYPMQLRFTAFVAINLRRSLYP